MAADRPVVLVTGATGFVGAAVCRTLAAAGYAVRRAVREPARDACDAAAPDIVLGDIGPDTEWAPALDGAQLVVHLAARTHVTRETADGALAAYRRINVDGTRRLAEQAGGARVRRLVYMSSVKVNGEATTGRPYTEADPPRPEDAYGVTKLAAERELVRIAADTGLETVVLRPPLVYGPGVKGNFLRLMALTARGWPLPLASIGNRRSLIGVDNLASAVLAALTHPGAAGRTFLVSDGESISTPALVRALARALDVPARLVPFPPAWLAAAAALAGRTAEYSRLAGSLEIDSTRIRRELDWQPRVPLERGLAETAKWYRETHRAPGPAPR